MDDNETDGMGAAFWLMLGFVLVAGGAAMGGL